ncbi:MAG: hypothetical protein AAFN51_09095 [Pseudomonadota bacterium]
MHKFLLGASVSAMLAFSTVQAGEIEVPSEAAMTFVGQFSDDHLSGMLSRRGGQSTIFIGLVQAHGQIVDRVLELAISDAVRKYGPEWQANMAAAWDPLMTEAELESLTLAGAQSPYTDKYLELRSTAGQSMQASSQDLFKQIMVEVLGEVQKSLEVPKG